MKTTKISGVVIGVFAGCLCACASSPPAPPQADESTRQAVNSVVQIELQTCEAKLANTRLALEEATRSAGRASAPPTDATSSCAARAASSATK